MNTLPRWGDVPEQFRREFIEQRKTIENMRAELLVLRITVLAMMLLAMYGVFAQ